MDRQMSVRNFLLEGPDAALLGRNVRDWVAVLSEDGLRIEQVVLVNWVTTRRSTKSRIEVHGRYLVGVRGERHRRQDWSVQRKLSCTDVNQGTARVRHSP
jgi:hypothetical protein